MVQHITLGDEDSKQAEVLLQFTPSDKELLINKSANAHVPLIVVSVIVPIFLIFVVTCSYFNQHIFVRKSSADVSLDDAEGAGEDVEKKTNIGLESLEMPEGIAGTDSKPGQEKENEAFEAEEKNAAAANAEQPKAGLKERVASFFRFGTAAAARIDEEAVMVEEVAEKVEEVAEKIVEAAEKVENAAAKVAEAAEEVMEESKSKTKVAVENETAKRSGGFVRLLKIFSNQKREAEAEKAAEDPKKEEVSDEEKVKADEAENEKGEDAKEEEEKKAEEPAPAATEEESLEKPKDKEEE